MKEVRLIPVEELARRICTAYHPYLGTTGQRVPCGTHIAMARSWHWLLQPDGDRAWDVLVAARTGVPEQVGNPIEVEV